MTLFAFPVPEDVVDPDANIKNEIIIPAAVMISVATVAVFLRFLSRRLLKLPLLWDDWLILVAMPFAYVCAIAALYGGIHDNVGRHIQYTKVVDLPRFLIGVYVFETCYPLATGAQSVKVPLGLTAAITVMWMISSVFVIAFSCSPTYGVWDLSIKAKCIDTLAFNIAQTAINIALDVPIIILPLCWLEALKINRLQKFTVAATILVGLFATLASALRLKQTVETRNSPDFDPTYSVVGIVIWTLIEIAASVICVCIPTMRPLLRFIRGGSIAPKALKFINPTSLKFLSLRTRSSRPRQTAQSQGSTGALNPLTGDTYNNSPIEEKGGPVTPHIGTFVDNSWNGGRFQSWTEVFKGGTWNNDPIFLDYKVQQQQQHPREGTWIDLSDTNGEMSERASSNCYPPCETV